MRSGRRVAYLSICGGVLLSAVLAAHRVHAAEGGAGVYLLGFRGPLAGAVPPPGVYVENDFYYYHGTVGAQHTFPTGGLLVAEVEGEAAVNVATGIWVTPIQVAGGSLGFSVTLPYGEESVSAGVQLTGPQGNVLGLDINDTATSFGDLYLSSFIGWHAGMAHWTAGVSVNAPSGQWQTGRLANMSFNHWAVDLFGALTWLDPALGYDASIAAGFTFNAENPATDYTSGTEFHLEAALTKRFKNGFSFGVTGYHYEQITGDSGQGARLGDYKGRVTGIGPSLGYQFKLGETPVATQLKAFKEFNAENRLEDGEAAFFTVTVPLGGGH